VSVNKCVRSDERPHNKLCASLTIILHDMRQLQAACFHCRWPAVSAWEIEGNIVFHNSGMSGTMECLKK
jgi:hypothetical protein